MRGIVAVLLFYLMLFGVCWAFLGVLYGDGRQVLVGVFWWVASVRLLAGMADHAN